MTISRLHTFLALAITFAVSAKAGAEDIVVPILVTAEDMHLEYLQPATRTYLVYRHGASGTGITNTILATSELKRERVGEGDAWVIEQHWEDETGTIHDARTVHALHDVATLSQTAAWERPSGTYRTTIVIDPIAGYGTIDGEIPAAARERMESGFAVMHDAWWLNWHSDLVLLPLLPYEKGGTLRVRMFDVGMPSPTYADYTVVAEPTLRGAGGVDYDCWLVERKSGTPDRVVYQRFWIDKASRVVVKEEDVFDGGYRSKVLLSVPATIEFPVPAG